MNTQNSQNSHDTDEDRLRRTLRSQAGRATPRPLALEDVTTTARRIRRRRTTLAALSTAAVVALAVPLGMAVSGAPGSQDEPPVAGQRQSSNPPERVRLEAGELPAGDPPGVVWLDRTTMVPTSGETVELERSYRQVAPFGDGYVVQGLVDDETGERVVEVLDAEGTVTQSYPTTASVAVSADATLVVLAGPDGELSLLQAGGTAPTPLDTQQGQAKAPVAVTGTAPCQEACAVYYAVFGPDSGVNVVSVPDGHLENAGPFERLDAVTNDGRRAGQVSHDDLETSSCSAVLDVRRQLWRTCDYSLGDFAPDGAHLVGTDAYLDGTGRSKVALLDAASGDPVVTYDVDTRAGDVIADWEWEDDEHLLLTVHSGGSWQIVRVGLDGTADVATDAVPGEEHESSLVLGQRS